MELKRYQRDVLDDIEAYLDPLDKTSGVNAAWRDYWAAKGREGRACRDRGDADATSASLPREMRADATSASLPTGMPAYHDDLGGVPNVCIKMSTGGGKTFLAASSVKTIFDRLQFAIAAVGVIAVSVAAADATSASLPCNKELIRNGSFEEVRDGAAVGWPTARHYSVSERGGMNGTRGIVYENFDEKDYKALLTQNVEFEHGKRYRFSVWQKTEDITRPPTICAEWSDANGRHLGGMYAPGVAGTHDWTKLEGMTMPIPPDAAKVRLCTYVKRGGIGRAWFDDVSMTEVVDATFGGVYSSAYRDAASSGKVLFRAPVNAAGGARARYSWLDANGERRTSDVAVSGDGFADVELDVESLAMGEQKVSCELRSASGERLGGGEVAFTRIAAADEPKVRFDRLGRTLVDGVPFFPLGMYVDKVPAGEALAVYTNSPFNCMMPYGEPAVADMDRAFAAGQKVIFPIHKFHPFKKRRAKGADTPEASDALVEARVNEFKGHSALLAWYACDETSPEHIPALARRQRLMTRIDPAHPTWTVLYQYGLVREYYQSFDVIGTDPYPVPETSVGLAAEWAKVTRSEVMGLKPMWQVVQAFDWNDYGREKGRMPTREEMTAMTWHQIANGANGIVYFHHRLLYRDGGKKFLRDRWYDICAAAESVRRFVPALLSAEPAPTAVCHDRRVSTRTLRHNGRLLLVATNSGDEPCRARVAFSERVGVPAVEFGNVAAKWRGVHDIELSFEPQGYGVVSFGAEPECERLPPLPEGAFTMAVIPDTQLYRGEGALVKPGQPKQKGPTRNPAFSSRVEWIASNLEKERIAFVAHVGDIIDARNPLQWDFASRLMMKLDGKVPYGISVGNHDSEGGDTVASGFTKAFPASRYEGRPWYVGQRGDNANSCQLFEAGGMKFVVLHLECNAPEDVLEWADGMMGKYKDRVGIIVTHMYLGYLTRAHDKLNRKHHYVDPPGYGDWFGVMAWKKVHGEKGTTAQEMWDRHFSKYPNLFLILCGDQSMATTWRHLQFGRNGNRVYSVLQDYPRTSDGEDWLRLFRFRPDKGVVEVLTYSPSQDRLCDDAGFWHGRSWHQFELPLPDPQNRPVFWYNM